ncbi:MAG TPA: DUF4254 domain-containing protein [Granulicella sp.]
MLDLTAIPRLHDQATIIWHDETHPSYRFSFPEAPAFADLVMANHRANFDLWHEEDLARDPSASDSDIACEKHRIDTLNQRRNDLVEQMDRWLLEFLDHEGASLNPHSELNSETPGLILDRLSILALKIYHTREEAHRANATDAHRRRNCMRLVLLEEQRTDLAGCLLSLWEQVLVGKRRFKLYRQMKMYNDPDLNPVLYRKNYTKNYTGS